jgi:hypothetical protein
MKNTLPVLSAALLALVLPACNGADGMRDAAVGSAGGPDESGAEPTGPVHERWEGFVKPPDAELRERLSTIQYHVTQEDGT